MKKIDKMDIKTCEEAVKEMSRVLGELPEFCSEITRFWYITLPNGNMAQVQITLNRNIEEWVQPKDYEAFGDY